MVDYNQIHLLAIKETNCTITRSTLGVYPFRPNFNPAEYVLGKDVDFVIAAPMGTYPTDEAVISQDKCLQMVQDVIFAGVLR